MPYISNTDKEREIMLQEIGVTSLRYLPLEETIRIIGLPQDQICTYCWNGQGI